MARMRCDPSPREWPLTVALPIGRRDQPGEHADGGGLAGSVRARAGRRSRRPPPRTTGRGRRSAVPKSLRSPSTVITGADASRPRASPPIGTFGAAPTIGPWPSARSSASAPSPGKLISVRVDQRRARERTHRHARGRRASRERWASWPGTAHGWPWSASGGTPAGQAMLEIPAGTLDPGESPRATAERELGEECGLAAATLGAGAVVLHRAGLLHRAPDPVPGDRPARGQRSSRRRTRSSSSRGWPWPTRWRRSTTAA